MPRYLLTFAQLFVMVGVVALGLTFATSGYAGDDNEKKRNSQSEKDRSIKEDHEIQGQVLEINTLKDPPEMVVATVDGEMRVVVIKTDEIARNEVHHGDHVSLSGWKESEVLFYADQVQVDSRFGAAPNDND